MLHIFLAINSILLFCVVILLAWDLIEKKFRVRNWFRLLYLGVLMYALLYDDLHWSLYVVSYLAIGITFTFKDSNEENNEIS